MVVISFPGGYTSPHEVAPSDPEVAPEPTPGPGTPVRDGHLTFVVDRADCEVDRLERGREVRTTDGQFCLVHLTVINADERSVVFRDTDQRAVSSDGAEYGVDSAASGLVARGTALRSVRVDPGDRVAGVMVFHLPAGAHLSRLRLHESSESRGVEVAVR